MHRALSSSFIIVLLLSGAALSQSTSGESLGDVARASRANQQTQQAAGSTPKVITNQDLPSESPASQQSDDSKPMTTVSGVKKSDRVADQRLSNRLQAQQRTAQQWKTRIQNQENRIADLQTRIDNVNASIRKAVGTAQYETPANRYQAIQTEKLTRLQEQLDQEKRKLSLMQDEARRAGME